MDNWVTPTLAGLIGTVIGVVLKYLNDKKTTHSKTVTDINDQAFRVYQDLVLGMKVRIDALEKKLDEIEILHLDCQKENSSLKTKMEFLQNKVEELTRGK